MNSHSFTIVKGFNLLSMQCQEKSSADCSIEILKLPIKNTHKGPFSNR